MQGRRTLTTEGLYVVRWDNQNGPAEDVIYLTEADVEARKDALEAAYPDLNFRVVDLNEQPEDDTVHAGGYIVEWKESSTETERKQEFSSFDEAWSFYLGMNISESRKTIRRTGLSYVEKDPGQTLA